jgi:hypothetical protein
LKSGYGSFQGVFVARDEGAAVVVFCEELRDGEADATGTTGYEDVAGEFCGHCSFCGDGWLYGVLFAEWMLSE